MDESDPTIDEQRDFYDHRWSEVAKRPVRFQHLQNRMFAIRRVARKLKPQDRTILDVGCGLGEISNLLSHFGSVDAVDISPEAIKIAQQRYPQVSFSVADVLDGNWGGGFYNLLVCSEVLEHIPAARQQEFVQKLTSRLTTDGHLILTTPNRWVSDKLRSDQPLEHHLTTEELADLISLFFQSHELSTVHAFFPAYCNRYRICQLIRMIVYSVPHARPLLENPMVTGMRGLYSVIHAWKSTAT